MLPARHLLLPAAGCCWLVRAAAGCYLLPAACCCLLLPGSKSSSAAPLLPLRAPPCIGRGQRIIIITLLFFPGSCVINSFSLTHSPLRLPGSADSFFIHVFFLFPILVWDLIHHLRLVEWAVGRRGLGGRRDVVCDSPLRGRKIAAGKLRRKELKEWFWWNFQAVIWRSTEHSVSRLVSKPWSEGYQESWWT